LGESRAALMRGEKEAEAALCATLAAERWRNWKERKGSSEPFALLKQYGYWHEKLSSRCYVLSLSLSDLNAKEFVSALPLPRIVIYCSGERGARDCCRIKPTFA
jgi:hypothetical protein